MGTIGKTHGVNKVMSPHRAAVATKAQNPDDVRSGLGNCSVILGSCSATAARSAAWSRSADSRRVTAFGPSASAGFTSGPSGPFFGPTVRGGPLAGGGPGGSTSFGPTRGGLGGSGVGASLPRALSTADLYLASTATGLPDTFSLAGLFHF